MSESIEMIGDLRPDREPEPAPEIDLAARFSRNGGPPPPPVPSPPPLRKLDRRRAPEVSAAIEVEIRVMSRIVEAFGMLDDAGRRRVWSYLSDVFGDLSR